MLKHNKTETESSGYYFNQNLLTTMIFQQKKQTTCEKSFKNTEYPISEEKKNT